MKINLRSHCFVILLVCMAILVGGCGSKEKIKVGFLYPSKNFPRFLKEAAFVSERLKQLGAEPIVMSGEDDETVQIQNGIKLLDKGVDLLFIIPLNGGTIAPLVREANQRGVPVIAYNRLISNVKYDLYFTGDNVNLAGLLCETALKNKPVGNYVILAGDRFDRNGIELKNAIDSILAPHVASGDVNIVYESHIEGWGREIAGRELEQAIESFGTNIDVVLACSDPMADGASEVLKKYDLLGKVILTGQDADIYAVKSVNEGTQTITIYHPYKVLGYKAAELALEIINGKSSQKLANSSTFNGLVEIPTVKVKSVLITKDNIEKELVEVGEYTWDQINN